MRAALLLMALAAWGVASCADSDRLLDGEGSRSEFSLSRAPEGLEGAVSADSMTWSPTQFEILGAAELEVRGPFRIVFRNASAQALYLRYDLRFLDVDGIFVDHFIPFGQPVHLPPQGQRIGEGEFVVRSDRLRGPEYLATMQVVASVELASP